MNLRQAAQQALEMLEELWNLGLEYTSETQHKAAIDDLRAALLADVTSAQVAHADALLRENEWLKDDLHDAARAFLAAERKPLTDEEIEDLWQNTSPYYDHQDFARAIERAHGIGEQT